MHCKRETTQTLFGTLYYGNFYKVLWTEIWLLPLSRGLRDCWTHELCESISWKLYDEFSWQGASYEVIVSRNLIDFTLWCPSYQSDGIGFLLKAVCGDFKIKVSMKCLAWGHCAQKFDEVVSFYRDPSECSIWEFLWKSFFMTSFNETIKRFIILAEDCRCVSIKL